MSVRILTAIATVATAMPDRGGVLHSYMEDGNFIILAGILAEGSRTRPLRMLEVRAA